MRSWWDHPRIRGEHSQAAAIEATTPGSSPHTRGALSPSGPGGHFHADHPRIRGEHLRNVIIDAQKAGSSPHTRGARASPCRRAARGRIIPAYAGSTSQRHDPKGDFTDHPRIRGEHQPPHRRRRQGGGSSPHTRGAPAGARRAFPPGGIIPAYAGSTWPPYGIRAACRDHPRIRGEHTSRGGSPRPATGSSPHTRGAPSAVPEATCRMRIIPAYAGSTRGFSLQESCLPDHPRIRGEHLPVGQAHGGQRGSSPHTRGAHLEIPAIPRIAVVIIPVFLYPSPTPQEEADRSMVLLTLS